jgi:VWFA-related protein
MILRLLYLLPLLFQFGETVKVNYVLIPVNVTNKHGDWISGLKKSDFSLYVDLHPVAIQHFSMDMSQPISTVIMVDASGSMGTGSLWERTLYSLKKLSDFVKPQDETALSIFQSRSFRLLKPVGADPLGAEELLKEIAPWGKTALYDELAYIPVYTKPAKYPKTQVILITDTHDNYSEQNPQTVIDNLLRVKVPVFTLAIKQTQQEVMEIDFLKLLAKYTGGSVEVVETPAQIDDALEHIFDTIHKMYLLGFAPVRDDMVEYHPILVSVKGKKALVVTAKKGYSGGPPKYAD